MMQQSFLGSNSYVRERASAQILQKRAMRSIASRAALIRQCVRSTPEGESLRRRRSARTRCYAQSNKDFLSKYSIALKEASETKYWIELIIDNNLASEHKFSLMLQEIEVIIKILVAITKKLKEKEK